MSAGEGVFPAKWWQVLSRRRGVSCPWNRRRRPERHLDTFRATLSPFSAHISPVELVAEAAIGAGAAFIINWLALDLSALVDSCNMEEDRES